MHDPSNNNCPINADPRNESCACAPLWAQTLTGDGLPQVHGHQSQPLDNYIAEVRIRLLPGARQYIVETLKFFEAQYGGGSQVFTESGGTTLHRALDVAREMVTWSPARRNQGAL